MLDRIFADAMPLVGDLLWKIAPHHRLLASACFLAGFLLLTIFPSFDRKTEIEEHGLIVGYAEGGFSGAWNMQLRDAIKKLKKADSIDSGLDTALADAELISFRMNFTTPSGQKSSLAYTKVPSRRGDSREACVLLVATNWTSSKKAVAEASWGLSIGVLLAKYLKQVMWLSKDVFVVFVDGSIPYGAGARAWLRAYLSGSIALRNGVLRQAIVLDTTPKPQRVVCDVEGINGMLPNQDIVNAYEIEASNRNVPVERRGPWESVFYHFQNGGVHSSHSPFLELQVPAITVRGQKQEGKRNHPGAEPEALAGSLEGIIRCLSNNLQQLHHSFNFYFYTSQRRHVSNGLYLYPVFAMQLPLLSFLMSTPAYRDIRSFLVGMCVIGATILACGSTVFFLATDAGLSHWLGTFGLVATAPLICEHPAQSKAQADQARGIVGAWLSCSAGAAALLAMPLRWYAFRVFSENDDSEKGKRVAKGGGVRLPSPLWDATRSSAGLAFLAILAPVTILSWAVAVPLTMVTVPVLLLARPVSLRHRPLKSLLLLSFLAGNLFLLATPPAMRSELVGAPLFDLVRSAHSLYHKSFVPALPREARGFIPTLLVDWLATDQVAAAAGKDFLLSLHELARDFNCVGGMLFPIFCFAYWPLVMLLVFIGLVLPAQHVSEEGMTLREVKLLVGFLVGLLLAAGLYGIIWRSTSSSGLGSLEF